MSATPRQIFAAALSATRKGFTVIPFHVADKLPRVAWGVFQETKPTEEDIKNWFDAGLFSEGFAYLTGNSSKRLLVIDFDDFGKAFEFENKFQDLAKTYKVMTDRGVHFYFFAAAGFEPRKQPMKANGKLIGDILWNTPVIAPPSPNKSEANPHVSPRAISQAELNAVIQHFAPVSEDAPVTISQPESLMSWPAIVAYFKREAATGRNAALFKALCMARDNGYYQADAYTKGLFDAFMFAPAPIGHKSQSERAHRNEFKRTLASVYSRGPRLLQEKILKGLSDDSRERLIGAGLLGAARLLDALLQIFVPGTVISRREIILAVGHIISHEIIDAALSAVFEGKLLFSKASPSLASHPKIALKKALYKDALCIRKKTGHYYLMPSAEKIQQITGAQYYSSTALKFEQIDSVRTYRAPLLKTRLDRERKRIYQAELGRAIAVTPRTIRSYLALIGYEGIPQTQFVAAINWENANPVLGEGQEWGGGYFLQSHKGEKAPAVLGAAIRFLSQKKAVMLMKKTASIYVPKGAKEIYQSGEFKADLAALMDAHAGNSSMNVRKDETPRNPDAARRSLEIELKSQAYWAKLASEKAALEAKISTNEAAQAEANKWEAIRLTRAKIAEVREDAAALCLMMPAKSLSHDNAARLLLQFGQETTMQTAIKTIFDWGFSKNSKHPIKNPVGLLIKRLKRGGARLADDRKTPFVTHEITPTNEGVTKGVWEEICNEVWEEERQAANKRY